MKQEPGDTNTIGNRRSRKVGFLMLTSAVIVIAAFALWLTPGAQTLLEQDRDLVRTETGNPGTVGTSGIRDTDQDAGVPQGNVLRDLETITGTNDGHELVGRRVNLYVPISQHINDVAFWIGAGDNRLLVVLARDDRDGARRQQGEPSTTGIIFRDAHQAAIAGSIQRVPSAEAMHSWGLTDADRAELMERRVYLRADTVSGS